jgi:hypothetical protein
VVKEVVHDFAVRRMTDREAAADNIALLTFAHYPKLVCPFTLDVDAMTGFIDGLEIVKNRQAEDGTAIGVGLAKAVAVLKGTEARSKSWCCSPTARTTSTRSARGRSRAGGQGEDQGLHGVRRPLRLQRQRLHHAQRGDDRHQRARSDREEDRRALLPRQGQRELEKAYAEIESLERTKRKTKRFIETFDLYPWFLPAGSLCYALAWMSSSTWARRLV